MRRLKTAIHPHGHEGDIVSFTHCALHVAVPVEVPATSWAVGRSLCRSDEPHGSWGGPPNMRRRMFALEHYVRPSSFRAASRMMAG
jgi:hypothetical protein